MWQKEKIIWKIKRARIMILFSSFFSSYSAMIMMLFIYFGLATNKQKKRQKILVSVHVIIITASINNKNKTTNGHPEYIHCVYLPKKKNHWRFSLFTNNKKSFEKIFNLDKNKWKRKGRTKKSWKWNQTNKRKHKDIQHNDNK